MADKQCHVQLRLSALLNWPNFWVVEDFRPKNPTSECPLWWHGPLGTWTIQRSSYNGMHLRDSSYRLLEMGGCQDIFSGKKVFYCVAVIWKSSKGFIVLVYLRPQPVRIYENSIYIWETDHSVPLTSPQKISPIGQGVPEVPMWNT